MTEKLMIGWSEADITPVTDKWIPLMGQYYERLTHEIHSRLKTVAVAISSGDEYFLEASIDNVGVNRAFHEKVCEAVHAIEPAIAPENIFFHAIHTHSAPSITMKITRWKDVEDLVEEKRQILSSQEYVDFVVPIMAQNFVNAWRNRKPGGIIRGFGNARIGHCRRAVYSNGLAEMYGDTTRPDFIGMEAGEDSGVEMLFTCDETGKRTGMLLNVACPSQNMESTYKVSSDFAGATRELLKQKFGEDFHTIYQISPAGCQSPRDLVRHYTTEPDFWHEDGVPVLANRLLNAVENATLWPAEFNPVLKHSKVTVTLPRRRASYTDYVAAKAEVARLTAIMPEKEAFQAFCDETHANEKLDGPGPYDSKLHHFVLIQNAKAIITRYEVQDAEPNTSFNMNVIRLGDIAIADNPFELYLYYGQNIKARTKSQQTFLVQLAAGASHGAGYLPSPDAEKFGGYGGCIINGQCGHDAGYKLADLTVAEINKL
ncbi:MAG: hypothetical protein IJT83_06570, partial [Victivallales bacterium]|nr:hypothetical protein [Victivallales bacterium]